MHRCTAVQVAYSTSIYRCLSRVVQWMCMAQDGEFHCMERVQRRMRRMYTCSMSVDTRRILRSTLSIGHVTGVSGTSPSPTHPFYVPLVVRVGIQPNFETAIWQLKKYFGGYLTETKNERLCPHKATARYILALLNNEPCCTSYEM